MPDRGKKTEIVVNVTKRITVFEKDSFYCNFLTLASECQITFK